MRKGPVFPCKQQGNTGSSLQTTGKYRASCKSRNLQGACGHALDSIHKICVAAASEQGDNRDKNREKNEEAAFPERVPAEGAASEALKPSGSFDEILRRRALARDRLAESVANRHALAKDSPVSTGLCSVTPKMQNPARLPVPGLWRIYRGRIYRGCLLVLDLR
jgi:hypothetical protein